MIYLKVGAQSVVILEPANVERIVAGLPAVSPDRTVMVAYCPDIEWLTAEITASDKSVDQLNTLLEQGLSRKPITRKGMANA
jgi:hypothetical protein